MAQGLTEEEAQRRLTTRGGPAEPPTSRSTANIVRANVVTPFNAILLALGMLTLAFGDWRDALFLGIVVSNSGIGTWQELRARNKLDALSALIAPRACVVRDDQARQIPVGELVEGDLVRLAPGDQVVADGLISEASGLLLDESILTGESRPLTRDVGEEVLSGSFVVEGSGSFVASAVGQRCYAGRITGTARQFRHPRSPLERGVNRLLYVLVAVMVPLGSALVVALWKQEVGIRPAVDTAVAGMVTLIPEGLVLLVSVTYAAAALRMARAGALAQQLNAIESLASVDTLCIDKTGTLTAPRLRVLSFVPGAGVEQAQLREAFGRYAAAAEARNATLEAIATAVPACSQPPEEQIPFASRRRFSAMRLDDGCYVLGAPELFPLDGTAQVAAAEQEAGRRVVALGTTDAFPDDADHVPERLRTLGLAVLAEDLRPDARETVSYLLDQGVELKVLSGDSPRTVGSIAHDVGISLGAGPITGGDLPKNDRDLAAAVCNTSVVGRISPEGKRRVVAALSARGRYVAMVGDGVNDVPALKSARLAIAQGSGTQMARTVADVVLVDGDFSAVPEMVGEGRRILRNIQRVTKLFVTKSVFAAFLIVAIGITPTDYPLLPRHLTIVGALTVGIPAFFLALAPSDGPWRTEGFLREVTRFAVPAGVAAGLGVMTSYLVALNVFDLGLLQARTAATSTLIVVGLFLVVALEMANTERTRFVAILCATLFAIYLAILGFPGLRGFFELALPNVVAVLLVALGAATAIGFLGLTDDRFIPRRSTPARRSRVI